MLIENYHNQPDRFAVCEEGPAFETTQMMVFKVSLPLFVYLYATISIVRAEA